MLPGMQAFNATFKADRMLLIGTGNGIPLDEFLCTPVTQWTASPQRG